MLCELDGLRCRMRAARKYLVRERDDARREDLVCHLDGELANRERFTSFGGDKEPGPRWSTVRNGVDEILCDFAERDTSLELATFGLGSRAREQALDRRPFDIRRRLFASRSSGGRGGNVFDDNAAIGLA